MSDQSNGGADMPPPPATPNDAMVEEQPRSLVERWDAETHLGRILAKAREGAMAEMGADPVPQEPDPAAAGVLANGETVTAEDLEGMPWYEARVEVYVRPDPPGDEYGEGGDKIAHTRATTQAPNFAAAAPRLDAELGTKWQQLLQMAPLADQAPTPRPVPVPEQPAPPPRFPTLIVVAALVPYLLLLLAILLTR